MVEKRRQGRWEKNANLPQKKPGLAWPRIGFRPCVPRAFRSPARASPHTRDLRPAALPPNWLRACRLALALPPVNKRELATCPSRAAKRERQSVADRPPTPPCCRQCRYVASQTSEWPCSSARFSTCSEASASERSK
ncbi:hypothetical protein L1887_58852 [Cichorium endivia]|nr:hypothetical protein L1887_58852 [Cichorium endivia]